MVENTPKRRHRIMKLEKLGAKEKPCEREKTYWPHGKYWDQDVFELKQYLWKLEDNGMTFSKLWEKKKVF